MVSFDGPRTWKEMFMIVSFQMLSQLANKCCVLLLDTILNCITRKNEEIMFYLGMGDT